MEGVWDCCLLIRSGSIPSCPAMRLGMVPSICSGTVPLMGCSAVGAAGDRGVCLSRLSPLLSCELLPPGVLP